MAPKKSVDLYNQALDYIQAGNMQEGITTLEESLMEDAEDPVTWRLYAVSLTAVGRPDDAATAMKKAETFGSDDVDSLLMKVAEAQMEGNLDKAISRFEDALEIDDSRFEIWAGYALTLIDGLYESDSLDASEKAVTLAPEESHAWYARGRILRLTRNFDQALEAFDKAVTLDTTQPIFWHERGMVQAELEKFADAAASFENVLAIHPTDQPAQQGLDIMKAKIAEANGTE
jgi:tetratricopeptide (TPR) repeat protein